MYALNSLKYIRFGSIHPSHLLNRSKEDPKIWYILASNRS